MKFAATVLGTPTPFKRGEAHITLSAAVRLLDAHPSYTVALRRIDVTRGHSHHLRRTDGHWSLVTVTSGIWPRNPPAEADEYDELSNVLRNLGIHLTTQESTP